MNIDPPHLAQPLKTLTPPCDHPTKQLQVSQTTAPRGALRRFMLHQLAVSLLWLVQLLGWGLVQAGWRRRLHGRALLLGFLATNGLLLAILLWRQRSLLHTSMGLWGAVLLSCAIGGWLLGRCAQRLAFWECYGMLLLSAAAWTPQLAYGWPQLLQRAMLWLRPQLLSETAYTLQRWALPSARYTSPGAQWLGPMWERLLVLGSLGGLIAALLGSSLAYLFYANRAAYRLWPRLTLPFEWRLAWRYVRGHGASSATGISLTAGVAILGIALGVASQVAVTAVMSGYQQDIQDKILATNAHIMVQKYGLDFVEYKATMRRALQVPEVLAAAPFVFNEAMLSSASLGTSVLLKGIAPEPATHVIRLHEHLCRPEGLPQACVPYAPAAARRAQLATLLQAPAAAAPSTLPPLLVGLALFQRLAQPLGSSVILTTAVQHAARLDNSATAVGHTAVRQAFRLAGVYQSGMHEFDSRLVYVNLPVAQKLLGLGAAVSGIELRVSEPLQVARLATQVYRAIGRYPYTTRDWRELNAPIFTALKLQKVVMFLVLCCIILVASFNIASTLFMAVVEKTADIALLKSIGSHDVSIMQIFVLQGWFTGVLGTALGVLLGLLSAWLLARLHVAIAAEVYMVSDLRVQVVPFEVLCTVLAALAIAHLATLYPAQQAADKQPVAGLQDT